LFYFWCLMFVLSGYIFYIDDVSLEHKYLDINYPYDIFIKH